MSSTHATMALAATFAGFGKAAMYTPPGGGAAVACTVIRDQADTEAQHGSARPVAGQVALEIRVSEVAAPAANGTVQFEGEAKVYRIIDRPFAKDALRLVMRMWAI